MHFICLQYLVMLVKTWSFSQLGNHGSNLTEEELETHTISAWKEGKWTAFTQGFIRVSVLCWPFLALIYGCLYCVILLFIWWCLFSFWPLYIDCFHLCRQGHMIIWKRLLWRSCKMEFQQFLLFIHLLKMAHFPSCYILLHFQESLNVSFFPNFLYMYVCSDLVDSYQIGFSGICRYFRNCSSSLPILQLPICAIPVGTWVPKIGEPNCQPLAMLRPNASLTSALNLLVQGVISLSNFEYIVQKKLVSYYIFEALSWW